MTYEARFQPPRRNDVAVSPRPAGSTTALRAATDPIDDTSPGKLMEGVLVAFTQFDGDVLSDRTRTAYRPTSRRTACTRRRAEARPSTRFARSKHSSEMPYRAGFLRWRYSSPNI